VNDEWPAAGRVLARLSSAACLSAAATTSCRQDPFEPVRTCIPMGDGRQSIVLEFEQPEIRLARTYANTRKNVNKAGAGSGEAPCDS